MLVRGITGTTVRARVTVSLSLSLSHSHSRSLSLSLTHAGIFAPVSPDDVVREADIVFVAVKASVLVRLIGRLTPVSDGKTRLFISLVSGVTRERMNAVRTLGLAVIHLMRLVEIA